MKLDLNALAAGVAAVLDAHGIPEDERRYTASEAIDRVIFGQWAATSDGSWSVRVWPATERIHYTGEVTSAAFAVLSTVYARVNGQGGEAERYGSLVRAAERLKLVLANLPEFHASDLVEAEQGIIDAINAVKEHP